MTEKEMTVEVHLMYQYQKRSSRRKKDAIEGSGKTSLTVNG